MKLKGKKVVLLAENNYQELELWVPYYRLKEEGAEVSQFAGYYAGIPNLPLSVASARLTINP